MTSHKGTSNNDMIIDKQKMTSSVVGVCNKKYKKNSAGHFMCPECPRLFTCRNYLIDHIKRRHSETLGTGDKSNNRKSEGNFLCSECPSLYTRLSRLRNHVRKKHPEKAETLISLKDLKTYKFKCNNCNRRFNKLYHLHFHRRKDHGFVVAEPVMLKCRRICPLCKETFENEDYQIHFQTCHDLTISNETHQFLTLNDFNLWRENIEKETKCKFIRERGVSKHGGTIKHFFVCHRSGNFVSCSQGKRKLKKQGSNKINAWCPASIRVNENSSGECRVTFVSTHVGHANNIYQSSSKSPEENILKKERTESAKKLKELQKRHISSLLLQTQVTAGESGWTVVCSEDTDTYFIHNNKKDCDCQFRCSDCHACIHEYTCSCADSTIHGNMCEHIHLLCRFMAQCPAKDQSETGGRGDTRSDLSTTGEGNESYDITIQFNEGTNQMSLSERKIRLTEKFNALLNSVTTTDEVEVVDKHIELMEQILINTRHPDL